MLISVSTQGDPALEEQQDIRGTAVGCLSGGSSLERTVGELVHLRHERRKSRRG